VFENRVLRRIFRPKREEVAGGCRRLHNEELHNLYVLPNVIRVIKSGRKRWAGCVAYIEEMRDAYKILIGKSRGKRSLGSPGRRWENTIRRNLRERVCVKFWTGFGWLRIGTSGGLLWTQY
jgi:hypothetical protein